jgi:hypothetical protein
MNGHAEEDYLCEMAPSLFRAVQWMTAPASLSLPSRTQLYFGLYLTDVEGFTP